MRGVEGTKPGEQQEVNPTTHEITLLPMGNSIETEVGGTPSPTQACECILTYYTVGPVARTSLCAQVKKMLGYESGEAALQASRWEDNLKGSLTEDRDYSNALGGLKKIETIREGTKRRRKSHHEGGGLNAPLQIK